MSFNMYTDLRSQENGVQMMESAVEAGRPAEQASIRLAREGAIGFITLHRPERLNALDVITARDLYRAAQQYADDETIRVIVLQGPGKVFCSGADLKYIRATSGAEGNGAGSSASAQTKPRSGYGRLFEQIVGDIHRTICEFRRAAKPVIAAVDGAAAAGGLGLALSADLVVASTRSTFEYAYFKTALTGAEGTTFFLPKLVGLRRALELALLNRRLTATQAYELGLISVVYETEKFEEQVTALARQLAEGPTQSYAETKRLMTDAIGAERLAEHLRHELDALTRAADGADFAEGLIAFFAKRSPQFLGKG
jgi:2-(1,2-epoxy-1,2-dihydrophenyl)acetyl-CoA isomerase